MLNLKNATVATTLNDNNNIFVKVILWFSEDRWGKTTPASRKICIFSSTERLNDQNDNNSQQHCLGPDFNKAPAQLEKKIQQRLLW